MRIVICGHRGVGKTSLLQRLKEYSDKLKLFDLDETIESSQGQTIAEIFSSQGEEGFRKIESEEFCKIAKESEFVISVGAGFDVSTIKDDIFVIFVRRPTDSNGRIFLDRPRLKTRLKPLEESKLLFQERDSNFLKRADYIYHMLEGMICAGKTILDAEKRIFETIFSFLRMCSNPFERKEVTLLEQGTPCVVSNTSKTLVTLEPAIFARPLRFQLFRFFAKEFNLIVELRDDLLSERELADAKVQFESARICYSFRKKESHLLSTLELQSIGYVDWALELGEVPAALLGLRNLIVSCHEPDCQKNLESLKKYSTLSVTSPFLKSSPQFSSFLDLHSGLEQLSFFNSKEISFLPRSSTGRWKWLRLLRSRQQKLNFICFWQGSAEDQPNLIESLAFICQGKQFAAVLGDPIEFSYSPVFHNDFFVMRNSCMLPIQMKREEWSIGFKVLVDLGLQWAAVTSPHKKSLFEAVECFDPSTREMQAANTFAGHRCLTTDDVGLAELLNQVGRNKLNAMECVIWGGGGTKTILQRALPRAKSISIREVSSRPEDLNLEVSPEVLVWAAPRTENMMFPPASWHPKIIIDLNYNAISPGLEYAQKVKCEYISGLAMFLAQARKQQEIWSQ